MLPPFEIENGKWKMKKEPREKRKRDSARGEPRPERDGK
jgi:hypothetical protein